MQTFTTPMMKQYAQIKQQYQDCLLLYRMGDFYELFMEDAHIGAQILNITLTSRPKGKDGRIPMAGVPYHAIDTYLAKLVKAGYKVAICEQISLPNKYGIIEREVVRIVTPGTLLDEKALEKKENNYIVSIALDGLTVAIATADISTGDFFTTEVHGQDIEQVIINELSRLNPVECIVSDSAYNNPELLRILKKQKGMNIFCFREWETYSHAPKKFLKKHFAVETLASFGIENTPLAIETAAVLLGYLQETQKNSLSHIQKITALNDDAHVHIDRASIINLELFSTIREGQIQGSLLSVLDETVTAMGGRLLKQWVRKPLLQEVPITMRHDAVEELQDGSIQENLRLLLKEIVDIERIIARLSVGIGNARDLIALQHALEKSLSIKSLLKNCKSKLLKKTAQDIDADLQAIITLVATHIVDEPPVSIKEGGIIARGVDRKLDELQSIMSTSKDWMNRLEIKERERTGIGSLKIRFNKVFGFYIEVTKSNLHLVPSDYMRKQTLVNGERFITTALKKHEERILTAEETMKQREYVLFMDILSKVLQKADSMQQCAQSIATADCLSAFSQISRKYNYTRPTLIHSGKIEITQGRHPVVERLLEEKQFIPNDVSLDTKGQQLLVITGPNMAGKSVLIRQVALITLMTQIGCFVPAQRAEVSIVDRIFVRSGASDVITSGLSTFMVEMVETAYILNNATPKSLIIMDEIGRGTSTYDGISIAWAVAEHLVTHQNSMAKTLFATHYHELQMLEQCYPEKIKNYHMAINATEQSPVFLHTLVAGGASHSFGVAVAKLAGVPKTVIEKAFQKLATLEETSAPSQQKRESIPTVDLGSRLLEREIDAIDIHQITPLQALNLLSELKEKIRLLHKTPSAYRELD